MNRLHFVRAKDNPFTVQRVTSLRYRFESGDWESHLSRLKDLGYRAAIVGPQGSGKSTLIRDLRDELESRGDIVNYIFLPHDQAQQLKTLAACFRRSAQEIVLLDGVERLSCWNRGLLYCRRRRLIVTVHKPQILPPFRLPTWIKTEPSLNTLAYILEEIGMDDDSIVGLARQLFHSHRGNVRSVLRVLYDRCAKP